MRKIMLFVLVGMFVVSGGLFADDGDYSLAVGQQQANAIDSGKIVKTKKDSKASYVQQAVTECNNLKEKSKLADAELSQAYQTDDTKGIETQGFNVWLLKKKLIVAEKKVDFAYSLNELRKILVNYPNSDEMKKLIADTKKEIDDYLQSADKIIELESTQKKLDNKLSKAQKLGEIIRQKELLKKMQQEYDN